jgi:hypothetical protein
MENLGFITISKNAHPNTDNSPWGWIVLDASPRVRIATWSGHDELKACQQLVVSHNAFVANSSLKEENERLRAEVAKLKSDIEDLEYEMKEMGTRDDL